MNSYPSDGIRDKMTVEHHTISKSILDRLKKIDLTQSHKGAKKNTRVSPGKIG